MTTWSFDAYSTVRARHSMRASINIILVFILFYSVYSNACSCGYDRSMDEVAVKSSVVFYGDVIGIEKIGKIVPFGKEQEYRITVFPREVYKGKAKKKYRFKGRNINNNNSFGENTDAEEIVVGGCGLGLEIGDKYVVFIEKGKKIYWSRCSEHILPYGTRKYEYFINSIKKML